MHRDLKPANILLDTEGEPQGHRLRSRRRSGLRQRAHPNADRPRLTELHGTRAGRWPGRQGRRGDRCLRTRAILYDLLTWSSPVQGRNGDGDPGPGSLVGPGPALSVPARAASRPRDHLPEVPRKATIETIRERRSPFGRPAPLLELGADHPRGDADLGTLVEGARRAVVSGLAATVVVLFIVGFGLVYWQWRRAELVAPSGSRGTRHGRSPPCPRPGIESLPSGSCSTVVSLLARSLRLAERAGAHEFDPPLPDQPGGMEPPAASYPRMNHPIETRALRFSPDEGTADSRLRRGPANLGHSHRPGNGSPDDRRRSRPGRSGVTRADL